MWAKEHNGKSYKYWLGIRGNKYGFMAMPYDFKDLGRVVFSYNSIWFRLR